jgi:hypothetical protein
MKKHIAILLIAALTLSLTGCASNEVDPNAPDFNRVCAEGRRDTPVRVATGGKITFNYDSVPTLSSTIKYADVIADVTIVEWLGESEPGDGLSRTYFRAIVNSTLMGKEYQEIKVIQSGNSRATMKMVPLFKNGDRFLMFLVGEDGVYGVDENMLLAVLKHSDEKYLIDRTITYELFENECIQKVSGNLWVDINDEYRKHDPVLAEIVDANITALRNNDLDMFEFIEEQNRLDSISPELYKPEYRDVFSYDDVVRIVDNMVKEQGR